MTSGSNRLWIMAGICAGCTVLFSFLFVLLPESYLYEIEVYSQDLRLRLGQRAPVDPRLAFVAIDQPSYNQDYPDAESRRNRAIELICQRYPWPREIWAIAIERLIQAGAKVVALDIVFAGETEADEKLKAVLDRYPNQVVVGANYVSLEESEGKNYDTLQYPPASVIDPGTNHPMQDLRIGLIRTERDADGAIRRIAFQKGGDIASVVPPEVTIESFAGRILRQAGRADMILPGTESHRFRYAAKPNQGFARVPFIDLFHPMVLEKNYNPKGYFKDKIVIIGPAASIFHDEHRTPFGGEVMLGPEIHLNFLSAALNSQFLKEATFATNLALTAWGGLVAWLFSWRFPRLFQRFSLSILCVTLYLLTAQFLYDYADLFIAVVAPVAVLLTSGSVGLVYDFAQARREKAQLRRTLERYVAKDVVRELLDNPQTYLNSLVGVRKPVTILFSDIRGFTSLTEGANAALLVKQLNEYFQEMVGTVVKNRGRLDKFIGDAVMADWGSFVSGGVATDAERAVLTALQMREGLKKLNLAWQASGLQPLAFGLGINHGEVIVGNLGSEEKMEVSVIGDAVNLASRLESLTKQYHLDLLLGESVASFVRERFTLRSVDFVRVQGKTKPVEVFTIPPQAADQKLDLDWLRHYEKGVVLYRQRNFQAAIEAFQESLRLEPQDELTPIYLERCEKLLNSPPPEGWSGVFETSKK
ncbi:MAG: CHASE2 domain-containing protein [Verrucomicrobiales bacterium]|nr:CHASE2 domain-containing protein [Verrucomicrobiales bacterium]